MELILSNEGDDIISAPSNENVEMSDNLHSENNLHSNDDDHGNSDVDGTNPDFAIETGN